MQAQAVEEVLESYLASKSFMWNCVEATQAAWEGHQCFIELSVKDNGWDLCYDGWMEYESASEDGILVPLPTIGYDRAAYRRLTRRGEDGDELLGEVFEQDAPGYAEKLRGAFHEMGLV